MPMAWARAMNDRQTTVKPSPRLHKAWARSKIGGDSGLELCDDLIFAINLLTLLSTSFVLFSFSLPPLFLFLFATSLSLSLFLSLCSLFLSHQFWTQLDKRYSVKHVVFSDVCNNVGISLSLSLPLSLSDRILV